MTDHLHEAELYSCALERENSPAPDDRLAADQGYALRRVLYHCTAALVDALKPPEMPMPDVVKDLLDEPAENNWIAEVRHDPTDGNGYVLRAIDSVQTESPSAPYHVRINDILGGHERRVALEEWLSWPTEPPR